jgi:hypothetical protein
MEAFFEFTKTEKKSIEGTFLILHKFLVQNIFLIYQGVLKKENLVILACIDILNSNIQVMHNEELHNLYSSPSIIRMVKSRRMRWTGHVARMGEKRNAYRILVGEPEGKRPLRRPRRRLVCNIKMDVES